MEGFLTPEQVGQELKVNRSTVTRWCRVRQLPAELVGDQWMIRRDVLAVFTRPAVGRNARWYNEVRRVRCEVEAYGEKLLLPYAQERRCPKCSSPHLVQTDMVGITNELLWLCVQCEALSTLDELVLPADA